MPDMTEDEILKYRSSAYPPEIENMMLLSTALAKTLDNVIAESGVRSDAALTAHDRWIEFIRRLKSKAQYYHKKRQTDFGIDHFNLRRLIRSIDEMISDSL